MQAVALTLFLLLMLGAFLGIARVDRRALPPVMLTAAFIVTLAGIAAGLLSH
jgi:hypothetical protein